jgi:hypothetical protein
MAYLLGSLHLAVVLDFLLNTTSMSSEHPKYFSLTATHCQRFPVVVCNCVLPLSLRLSDCRCVLHSSLAVNLSKSKKTLSFV